MRRSVALRRSGEVCSEPLLGALSATERWIRPVFLNHRNGPAADQVLLLSMGVVATPSPQAPNPITSVLPLPQSPARADALLFIESRGKVTAVPNVNRTADQSNAAGAPQRRY